jgi:hypothetical protein
VLSDSFIQVEIEYQILKPSCWTNKKKWEIRLA